MRCPKDFTRANRVFLMFSLLACLKSLEDLYVECWGGVGELFIHDKTSRTDAWCSSDVLSGGFTVLVDDIGE
jgi:hypothetical protein